MSSRRFDKITECLGNVGETGEGDGGGGGVGELCTKRFFSSPYRKGLAERRKEVSCLQMPGRVEKQRVLHLQCVSGAAAQPRHRQGSAHRHKSSSARYIKKNIFMNRPE